MYNIKEDWKEVNDLAAKNPKKTTKLLEMVKEWKATLPSEPKASALSSVRQKGKAKKKNKKKKNKKKD